MSFQGQVTTGQGHSSTTLTLKLEVTPTGSVLWEQGPMSETSLGGMEEEEEEQVWKRYQRLTKMGVTPTLTPCPSPVNFYLPSLPPLPSKPPRHHKATSDVLRDLDPRVRFYVTASNAVDYVTSGKSFTRSATPVWNRAPLGRISAASTATFPQERGSSGQSRTERSPGEGGGGGEGGVKLNLEVMKLNKASSDETQNRLSPFTLNFIHDHVPSMDVTIIEPRPNDYHDHLNTMVNQDHGSGRPRGRSANYGSAKRRLGLKAGDSRVTESEEGREESQPVHPFLRMYQTRPGAFARLLSRETDLKSVKVAPGSTIASLMVPHPVVAAGERTEGEEEEEEEFDGCVKGTTM